MKFNPSDFLLKDIVYVNNNSLKNKFLKLTIANAKYPILISHVDTSRINTILYCRKGHFNKENLIEQKVIEYSDILNIEYHESYTFLHSYPYLKILLEDFSFEISDVNQKTNIFLTSLIEDDLIVLAETQFNYKDLENPTNSLDRKFRNLLLEKCIKEINENKKIHDELIKINKDREKRNKELEKHMETVIEKERQIQKFNDNLPNYSSKNLNDYKIRW